MAGKKHTDDAKDRQQDAPGAPSLPTDLSQEISKAAAAAEESLQSPKKQRTSKPKKSTGRKTRAAAAGSKPAKAKTAAPAKPAAKGADAAPAAQDDTHRAAEAATPFAGVVPPTSGNGQQSEVPARTEFEAATPEAPAPAKAEKAAPDTSTATTAASRPTISGISTPAPDSAAGAGNTVEDADGTDDIKSIIGAQPSPAPPKDSEQPSAKPAPSPAKDAAPETTPDPAPEPAPEPAQAADTSEADVDIDDDQVDDAVADIVRAEGDALLEVQDKAAAKANPPADRKAPSKPRWWKRKWFVWSVVLVVVAAATAAAAVPESRYAVLNALGVRVSASVTVVDNTTRQPLKDVSVQIGSTSAKTDEAGAATITDLKLGPHEMVIERIAFATVEEDVTLGWGSNPLGTYQLAAAGVQYTFVLREHLSAQPVEGAEVASGQSSALSDEDGTAVLAVDSTDEDTVTATITADGYRTEELSFAMETEDDITVTMVPDRKAVFVSRGDNGHYNVYGTYADGEGRSMLLEGTGNEDSHMTLAVSPDAQRAAIVSTREDIRDADGTLLQSLTILNSNSGNAYTLERASEIVLVDWIDTTLVYRMTLPGASADSAERQRLMSYDYREDARTQVAAANEFTSIASAQGAVYYSAATAGEAGELVRVNPDGTDEQVVLEHAVQHAYRTSYGTLTLQTDTGWYELALGQDTTAEISTPSSFASRTYVTNNNGTRSLWVDGDALMAYDIAGDEDMRVDTQAGLGYPVYWLTNSAAVYRVADTDYAVDVTTGDAYRLANVIPTTGLVQAY